MTETRRTYNGWANYETWCVNLWLTNEQGSEETLRMLAQMNASLSHRADCIRNYVFEDMPIDGASLATDLLQGALGAVDWREIAENHQDDDKTLFWQECVYCYNLVTTLEVPEINDDEMWDALAGEHDPECEWVATRAHRLYEVK